MKSAFAALLLIAPLAVQAQDLSFSTGSLEACMEVTEENPSFCIGEAAATCMESTPYGYSTVVMSGCMDAELSYWDKRLNVAYKQLRASAKVMDQDRGAGAPSQEIALRDMQRAWIKFRDQKCSFSASQWGGGTGAGPAYVGCLMEETGMQAIFLEAQQGG